MISGALGQIGVGDNSQGATTTTRATRRAACRARALALRCIEGQQTAKSGRSNLLDSLALRIV